MQRAPAPKVDAEPQHYRCLEINEAKGTNMSKKSPFGRLSTGTIARIRRTVELYVTWRREYLNGTAGELHLLVCTIGHGTDEVVNRTSFTMHDRTRKWRDRLDDPELRELNRLHELRLSNPTAYEVAMLRRELAAAS